MIIFHSKDHKVIFRFILDHDFLTTCWQTTTGATLEDCQCQRLLLSTQNSVALAKHHNRYKYWSRTPPLGIHEYPLPLTEQLALVVVRP